MSATLSEAAQLTLEAIGERGATMIDVIEAVGQENKPAAVVKELLDARLIKLDGNRRMWRADAQAKSTPATRLTREDVDHLLRIVGREEQEPNAQEDVDEEPSEGAPITETPASPAREEPEMAKATVTCESCGKTFKAGPRAKWCSAACKAAAKARTGGASRKRGAPAPARPAAPASPAGLPSLSDVRAAIATMQAFADGIAGIVR